MIPNAPQHFDSSAPLTLVVVENEEYRFDAFVAPTTAHGAALKADVLFLGVGSGSFLFPKYEPVGPAGLRFQRVRTIEDIAREIRQLPGDVIVLADFALKGAQSLSQFKADQWKDVIRQESRRVVVMYSGGRKAQHLIRQMRESDPFVAQRLHWDDATPGPISREPWSKEICAHGVSLYFENVLSARDLYIMLLAAGESDRGAGDKISEWARRWCEAQGLGEDHSVRLRSWLQSEMGIDSVTRAFRTE